MAVAVGKSVLWQIVVRKSVVGKALDGKSEKNNMMKEKVEWPSGEDEEDERLGDLCRWIALF